MASRRAGESRVHPGLWTALFAVAMIGLCVLIGVLFSGTLNTYVPVTLVSDRAGLVMESGGKVKMRGVQVGKVTQISGGPQVSLKLDIFPDQLRYIPDNVRARIRATTLFGAKYVDLIYPENPSPRHLAAGALLRSENVSTEVNTVFQNLTDVLAQIDPAKLNAVLTAFAVGLRGQGERIGEATTAANQVLLALNPRYGTIRSDWRAVKRFGDAYSAAAQNILTVLDAATTTSATVTANKSSLDSLLLSTIGFAQAGIDLLGPNRENIVTGINTLQPTTSLLMEYNPELTCLLVGGKGVIDQGFAAITGGHDGATTLLDSGLLIGADMYKYPDNLPIIGAKGGPGGKPGCGSLPDVAKNFPVREVVTNTGWGTGMDIRPNPGIGFPGWANYLPVTRGVPEAPSIRYPGGPAPGPIPYPGAPPFGAPQYAPDGTPLYPGLPPAPPPGAAPSPGPTPGSEPFVPPHPATHPPTPNPLPQAADRPPP
jgi:phospholipid/cholesterol/gamma-HCH transport system substrate-binding protein